MLAKIVDLSQNKFYCEKCDYKSFRKNDYEKHLLTLKHNAQKCSEMLAKYACECGKQYKHNQSFKRHKKTCSFENQQENKIICQEVEEDPINYKEMLLKMMKENNELRKQVTELIPKVGNNNNNINQKFNIQVFLNEQCKDAINMNDFVKSIKISLEQLDIIKNKGITEGLGNAIIENMNKLSVYERPLHCTDVKRVTLYVKEDDVWEKDKTKNQIKKAIKNISGKQYSALQEWIKKNPDYMKDEEKKDYFSHTLSTIGKTSDNTDEKIIKKLCNQTYVKDCIDE